MQSAKRQKLDETVPAIVQNQQKSIQSVEEEQPAYFLDLLSDHCILDIFKNLDLGNLCSMGHTCRRLHRLAKYHFGLKYPNEAKKLEQFEKIERNLLFSPSSDDYIHCFGGFKTITFNKNSMSPTLVKKFVNIQMNKPKENRIEGISFKGFNDNKYLEMCELLHDVLFDVQMVSFVNVTANGFYDSILQYCATSMQKLMFEGEFCVKGNGWLSQKFPKLEHLSLHTCNDIEWKDIEQLFHQNPNIKVSLLSQNTENINRFIKNGVINELHIRIKYNFDYYIYYFKKICARSISIRLHLSIAHNVGRNLIRNIQQLVDLKDNIDGLYFEFDAIDAGTINAIMKIERLNILQVPIESHTQALAHLPNLKELYIYPCKKCDLAKAPQHLELLQDFAGHCKSLQKLVFRYPTKIYERIGLSIVDTVNIRRMALDGAERLKFCFNISPYVKSLDTVDVLSLCLVDLQPLCKH